MSHISTILSKKIGTFLKTLGLNRKRKEHISALLPIKSISPITNFDKQNKKEVIDSFNKLLNQGSVEKKEYLNFVTEYYKNLKYTVWEYSKEKDLIDGEIHLVIKKESNILLIQCYNGYDNLSKNNAINFEKESISFVEENKIFQSYNIQLIYIMPTLLLEESAYKYIKKSRNIHYQILKENI